MQNFRLTLRFLHIVWVFWIAAWVYFGLRLRLGRAPKERVEALRGNVLASAFEKLGATFIKLGQIMSTRPDLFGPGYTGALARLQDAVPPAPFSAVSAVLKLELAPEAYRRLVFIEEKPIAAASVAQVHKARLDTGEEVALKVQRLDAENQIERDLAILGGLSRAIHKVPSLRLLSIPGAVQQFGEALRGQLDFRKEAENNRRFAKNFEGQAGVGVPALFADFCSRRVLGMQFVHGAKATDTKGALGDKKKLAQIGGHAILQMVFLDGFVHADLHPGNILLTPDDRVVLIDLGMVTEIPPELQRPWVDTFIALSQKDGAEVARLFYEHAPAVGNSPYSEFEREVTEQLNKFLGKSLGEVEIGAIVSGMMNVLRRHKVQVDPCFTVVHIALLVAEGLGKQLDPTIDMVPLAVPYLMRAATTAPPGRAPNRVVPSKRLPT